MALDTNYLESLDATELMPTDARHQPLNYPQNGPSFLDVAAAAQHQYNITDWMPDTVDEVSQYMDMVAGTDTPQTDAKGQVIYKHVPPKPAAVPGFSIFTDPLKLQGYEDYIGPLSTSQSPAELELRKQHIDVERQHQQLIASDGIRGAAVAFSTGMVNPVTLATMMIPLAPEIVGLSRTARVALGTAGVMAGATAQELAMQGAHETADFKSGIDNVAMQTVVGGLLSMIHAQGVTAVERANILAKVEDEAKNGVPGENPTLRTGESAGSAYNQAGGTNYDNTIADGPARALSKSMGKWNPMNIVYNSDSNAAKIMYENLGIVRFMLNKNLRKVVNARSVEISVARIVDQRDIEAVKTTDRLYAEYGARVGSAAVSRNEFSALANDARAAGDVHEIPEVQKMAYEYGVRYKQDEAKAIKLGMLKEDFQLLNSKAYAPDVWDRPHIVTDGVGFRTMLTKAFTETPIEKIPEEGVLPIRKDIAVNVEGPPDQNAKYLTGQTPGEGVRSIVLRDSKDNSEVGRALIRENADSVTLLNHEVGNDPTGVGYTPALIDAAIEEAKKLGKPLVSDTTVSASQLRAFDALSKRGYNVEYSDPENVKAALQQKSDAAAENAPVVKSILKPADEAVAAKKLAEADKATAELKTSVKAIDAARSTKEDATRELNRAQSKSDVIDEKLSELEAKRQYLHEDMSGSTPEQLAKEQTRVDREIERTKERGHAAEADLEARKQALLESEKALNDARNAAKAAKTAAQDARTAADTAKQQRDTAFKNEKVKPTLRTAAEVAMDVEDTVQHILGTVHGTADLGRASNPKPLRHRTLAIPYEYKKDWLVRDLEGNTRKYHRSMVPQIEMREAFGSADLQKEFDAVDKEYKTLLAKAAANNNKDEIKRLTKQQQNVINALETVRQRVLNQIGPKGNDSLQIVRAARWLRGFNYLTMPGAHVLSAMSDYGQLIAKYGLVNTGIATAKFLTNAKLNKLVRTDAQDAGSALSNLLGNYGGAWADIGNEVTNSGRMDRAMNWSTRMFTKVSGMGAWNTSMQTLASMMEQQALIRQARIIASGGTLSAYRSGILAQHGIDEGSLKTIAEQFEKHGETDYGLTRLRTELWDKEHQDLARTVEEAIVSNGRSVTHNLVAGDLPLFMNSELARVIFQFKSFGMGAVNRIMIPRIQGLAHGDLATINGMYMMLGIGALSSALKDVAAGREPDLRPGHVMGEAIKWSGISAFLPELLDIPFAAMPNLKEVMPSFLQGFTGARTGGSPMSTAAGPAFGTADNALKALHFLTTLAAQKAGVPGVEATQAGAHAVRKLFPLQNYFLANRLVNATEGTIGNFLDLQGATGKSFYDTLTESRPPKE